MTHLARVALVICSCLILDGCAISGARYSEAKATEPPLNAADARIYMYRIAVDGFAVQPQVTLDGRAVGQAVPNGFFYVDAKPGSHELVTSAETNGKLSLALDRGQKRYVRLNVPAGSLLGPVYPELVADEVGENEIQNCRYTGK